LKQKHSESLRDSEGDAADEPIENPDEGEPARDQFPEVQLEANAEDQIGDASEVEAAYEPEVQLEANDENQIGDAVEVVAAYAPPPVVEEAALAVQPTNEGVC
jgi:hypothetical protein